MKFVVFVDAENVSSEILKDVYDIIKPRGKIVMCKVFGDFSILPAWKDVCIRFNADPVMVWRKSGKNSSDIKMVQQCVHMMYSNPQIQNYVLVTGDGDFTHMVQDLKVNQKDVIVMGNSASSSNSLRECCDEFIEWPRVSGTKTKKKLTNLIKKMLRDAPDGLLNCGQVKSTLLQIDAANSAVNYGESSFQDLLRSLDAFKVVDHNGGHYVRCV